MNYLILITSIFGLLSNSVWPCYGSERLHTSITAMKGKELLGGKSFRLPAYHVSFCFPPLFGGDKTCSELILMTMITVSSVPFNGTRRDKGAICDDANRKHILQWIHYRHNALVRRILRLKVEQYKVTGVENAVALYLFSTVSNLSR